jgi:hypothetical protein
MVLFYDSSDQNANCAFKFGGEGHWSCFSDACLQKIGMEHLEPEVTTHGGYSVGIY